MSLWIHNTLLSWSSTYYSILGLFSAHKVDLVQIDPCISSFIKFVLRIFFQPEGKHYEIIKTRF